MQDAVRGKILIAKAGTLYYLQPTRPLLLSSLVESDKARERGAGRALERWLGTWGKAGSPRGKLPIRSLPRILHTRIPSHITAAPSFCFISNATKSSTHLSLLSFFTPDAANISDDALEIGDHGPGTVICSLAKGILRQAVQLFKDIILLHVCRYLPLLPFLVPAQYNHVEITFCAAAERVGSCWTTHPPCRLPTATRRTPR